MSKRPADTKADIKIRLTEGLRRNIERAAKQNGVSMNAEMIHRLANSFNADQAEEANQAIMEELNEARGRVDELENLLANIKQDMQQAVLDALAKAGLTKGGAK
jgi:hypothetical protein